jgi:hypothetical protein
MYTRNDYGGGTSYDESEIFNNTADYIQDLGATVNSLADSVEDESELITRFREEKTPEINDVLQEIGQWATTDVSPDSLVGTMRGYSIEEAEDEFRNNEFQTHVIASYQTANHTNLYGKSDGSMRRITDEADGYDVGTSDWQLHVRLFEWYDDYYNQYNTDVYTHTEATAIHPEDHYNGVYWEYDWAKQMVKHLLPQWDYTYDKFANNYDEQVEPFLSEQNGYPYL